MRTLTQVLRNKYGKGAVNIGSFKYIELFAGIGGFRSALDPLGGDCVFASEIDRFATESYRALYNGAPELHGDITKIDASAIPDHDVLVGGFPCQAFSVAGQRKGFEEARGTLFFEIARIASAKQPRLMLLENVKGLLSHDKGNTFETMCAVLNDIGYAIDFRVLNSKHYGVPQNRERIFVVCDRDAEHAEWEVVGSGVEAKAKRRAQDLWIRTFNFDWPTNDTVTTRLRDILEDNVDERYYLSEEKTAKLVASLNGHKSEVENVVCINPRKVDGSQTYQHDRIYEVEGVMTTLQSEMSGRFNIAEDSDDCEMLGLLDMKGNESIRRVYSPVGIAPTLTTMGGGHREPKIAEIQTQVVGYTDEVKRQSTAVYSHNGLSPTIDTQHGNAGAKIAVQMNRHAISHESDVSHCLMARDYKGFGNQDMTGVIETEIRAVLTPDRPEKKQNGRRFKDDGAQDKHGVAIGRYPRYRIRKLTPLECWRLQGFTDTQHETVKSAGISDSQRYKQAGNAVTVNVISAIGERMIPLLDVKETEVSV